MKKLLTIALCICASTAMADPVKVATIPPGDDKIVAIKKGQEAPFDGQLFDTNTAIRWGNWLEEYRYRITFDVDTQKSIDDAKIQYLNQVIVFEQDKYTQVTTAQEKRMAELQAEAAKGTPWYQSFGFGVGVGVVASVALISISVWAVSATSSSTK